MNDVTQKAVDVLLAIAEDKDAKLELRIEAAKLVVNRPRHFVEETYPER